MTTKCCRILSRRLGTGARLIAVCILFHGGGTWLQAQVSADVTVTGDFARTVVRTHSYAEYVVAVENAKNGNIIEKNEVETQGEIKGKRYDGTLTLPEATNGQSFICLMAIVSDDGCEMAIDNAAPWLAEYGQGHSILKGARPWPGEFVSGKTYNIKIHYSQVWFKPGINDHDGISVILCLLPIDIDIIHPATGEMSKSRKHDEGGYIAIRRDEKTPVTKLIIHACPGLPSDAKFRIKLSEYPECKLWKDEARTEEVASGLDNSVTEFPTNIDTILYFEGFNKTRSLDQYGTVELKLVLGQTIQTVDSVRFRVVEAEFTFWLNIFIPDQWGDLPAAHPIHWDVGYAGLGDFVPVFRRKIFAGDDRDYSNTPLTNPSVGVDDKIKGTQSRAHQQVVIIPFRDLSSNGRRENSDKNAMGQSTNYYKRDSVPDPSSSYSSTNRLLPDPHVFNTGRALTTDMKADGFDRIGGSDKNAVKFKFHGSATNPIVSPAFSIDWDFELGVDCDGSHVLQPQWKLMGNLQDGFPAYEIYIMDSDGNGGDKKGTPIYRWKPPAGATPASLAPGLDDQTVSPSNGVVP